MMRTAISPRLAIRIFLKGVLAKPPILAHLEEPGADFSLSPLFKREYAEYIASAKQHATKQKRIDKILPMIEAGVGLNDKYRNR